MKSPNLQPALSPIQREILVGGMLGDLSIYRAKLTHNARLYVQQGAVHTEYLNHLYSVLQNLCSSGPRPRTRARGPRPGPKLSVSLDQPSLRPNPSAADYGVACLAEGSALARGPPTGPRTGGPWSSGPGQGWDLRGGGGSKEFPAYSQVYRRHFQVNKLPSRITSAHQRPIVERTASRPIVKMTPTWLYPWKRQTAETVEVRRAIEAAKGHGEGSTK